MERAMKGVYTTFIKPDEGMYLVYIPDVDAMTQGMDFYDAVVMARDLLGTISLEQELPEPMSKEEAIAAANAKDIDGFTFADAVMTYVDIDTDAYKRNTRAVRRTVSLPAWLNEKAETAGMNLSAVLQDALIERSG